MTRIKPIFRIFDYKKAIEFYIIWLGFEIKNEHTFGENFPLYLQISLGDIEIHLSEHHGDCSPGAKVIIENFPAIKDFHTKLLQKDYKYNKPQIEPYFNPDLLSFEVTDPFNNKITFTGTP